MYARMRQETEGQETSRERFKSQQFSSENAYASRDKNNILLYHKIEDKWEWGITRQRISQFEKQMKFLYKQGYKLMRLDLSGQEKNFTNDFDSENKKIFLTFDDGYESVYTHAFPILEKFGFSATVFLITGWVGKKNLWDINWGKKFNHLSWSQIEELKKFGFNFGSHTVNHPDLTKLNGKEVEYELLNSKNMIEDRLGERVEFLSYPFGKYNRSVQRIAEDIGYKNAFTICSGPKKFSDPYALGRLGIYLFDSSLTLHIKLNQTPIFWIEDMKGRIINQFANGTTLFKSKPKYDFCLKSEKPKSIFVKKV